MNIFVIISVKRINNITSWCFYLEKLEIKTHNIWVWERRDSHKCWMLWRHIFQMLSFCQFYYPFLYWQKVVIPYVPQKSWAQWMRRIYLDSKMPLFIIYSFAWSLINESGWFLFLPLPHTFQNFKAQVIQICFNSIINKGNLFSHE